MTTKIEAAIEYLRQNGGRAKFEEVITYLESLNKWNYIRDDIKYAARHRSDLALLVHNGEEYLVLTEMEKPKVKQEEKKEIPKEKQIRIIEPDYSVYIPTSVPPYVPVNGELTLLEIHLETGVPLLFVGPKGVGKTLSIAHFAYKKQIPLIQFDCSETTKRQDLLGRFVLLDGEVEFVLGVLPQAIEAANKYGEAILVLEELNALTPQMQKTLNQLLDWRRHVFVPEINKVYTLKPGAKLLIAATMNPSTYGGVYELNEDLKSRFAQVWVDYPDERKEQEIIETVVGKNVDPTFLSLALKLAQETRKGWENAELSYALSPRDLVLLVQLFEAYKQKMDPEDALKFALRTAVLGRYEDKSERDTVSTRIQSIFGVVVR